MFPMTRHKARSLIARYTRASCTFLRAWTKNSLRPVRKSGTFCWKNKGIFGKREREREMEEKKKKEEMSLVIP